MNNPDQTQHDPEAELEARIQATLAHASACSKACEGMADPVAEVGRLKALAGLTEELGAALELAVKDQCHSPHCCCLYCVDFRNLLARVRAVKGNRPIPENNR